MASDPPEVGGRHPTLWDGGPTRDALFIPETRVSTTPPTPVDRHRLLWRDSATILIGVVLALLATQALGPPSVSTPTGSATPEASDIAIGTVLPQPSLAPGETYAPIIDPSLGIDATPTPIPVITPGPTPTPGPSPSPSVKPSAKPSPKPTTKPTPKPTDTPAPPNAAFSWTQTGDVTFDFANSSTGDTSSVWDFGDTTGSTASNPTHDFPGPGDYTVTLTVTGPGGTDQITHSVHVEPLPTPT